MCKCSLLSGWPSYLSDERIFLNMSCLEPKFAMNSQHIIKKVISVIIHATTWVFFAFKLKKKKYGVRDNIYRIEHGALEPQKKEI